MNASVITLAANVNDILSRHILIHDQMIKFSIRKLIPIPGGIIHIVVTEQTWTHTKNPLSVTGRSGIVSTFCTERWQNNQTETLPRRCATSPASIR